MRSARARAATALLVSMLTAAAWGASLPAPVAAGRSVFVVDQTGDKVDDNVGDGICDTTPKADTVKCSLRAALQEANASADASEIHFAIATGSGKTKTITPNTPLPTIVHPLTIDGYTQPGSSVNTGAPGTNAKIRVELNGQFLSSAGLAATAPVTIRGLAIYWFGRGIQLSAGSDGSRILGNYIGTDATGTEDRGNDSTGILVNSDGVQIGSIVRADRNLISGNTSSGINLGIASDAAVIQGNLIGTKKNGRDPIPNEGDGIFVTGSSDHLIGGGFAGQGNVIAWNGGDGVTLITVVLSGEDLVPHGVRIGSNRVFRNDGHGIDLADDGVTRNDAVPDKDKGPNGLQNFPKIQSAAQVAEGTVIRGQLASRRDAEYEIQLFSSPAGDPEGKVVLATFTVRTGADGKVTFNRTVDALEVGSLVTATATDVARSQTSEFGPARSVTP
jgi:hypothetical protein